MEAHSLLRRIGHTVAWLALLTDEVDLVEYSPVHFLPIEREGKFKALSVQRKI